MRGKGCKNKSRFGHGGAQIVYQQYPAMGAQIAIDQRTDIMILRQKDAIFR